MNHHFVYGLSMHKADGQTMLTYNTAAADMLTRRAGQLNALLACLIGEGGEVFRSMDGAAQDNVLWLASDMALEVKLLSELVASGEAAE
ncbi:hypothetical protein THUN1379_26930 [Paludibacterium sp. THUN1379]|uniref:hypothetical protein n=1 Tax=Paludibacterium sp. THUN1379 TaxID=3112107 RepID=UPI00308D3434|nr:hypothetical protein THUN1379_26930 [Paludibacterium sp. THUN1379]